MTLLLKFVATHASYSECSTVVSTFVCVYVFVNAITLKPLKVSSEDCHSIMLPLSKLR